MTTGVQLDQHKWILGELIGSGGFGNVRLAKSEAGDAVAKLVPKEPGAERELLFADLKGARNVIPMIDSGETQTHWVIVMTRADKSLRQHLDDANGPLAPDEAVGILTDIAETLVDLEGKVVHRDVKPENVLLLNGHWCLADFGISRYAEAATAPNTRKYAMSPAYAAPERWRGEHADIATDVYSLGVIAYEMLIGARPFEGPGHSAIREQHLHADPPQLSGVPSRLGALVEECLYKAPGARPKPGNLLARITQIGGPPPPSGLARLEEVHRAEIARRAQSARRESQAQTDAERRAGLTQAATKIFTRISGGLVDAIVDAAPSASVTKTATGGWSIRLNEAQLRCTGPTPTTEHPWGSWQPPAFEVIAHAHISVRFPRNQYGYEGRGHSLWYCDAQAEGSYQWFETAFMATPLIPQSRGHDPFALDPGIESAKALWNGMAEYQLAWPFTVVSSTDLDEFIERWADWLGAAAQAQLQHPPVMPERSPEGSWRC